MKITIHKNPHGDTRTAPKGITFKQFQEANNSHIVDVTNTMLRVSEMMEEAACMHDHTKKSDEEQFYKDFLSTMNEGTDFVSGKWYQHHVNTERHHLLSRCPEDVNLLEDRKSVV